MGPELTNSFRRGAYYVDAIFKGAAPADLPVEQPESFVLVVNTTTAESLGSPYLARSSCRPTGGEGG